MQKFTKLIIVFILIISSLNISKADYFENLLNLETGLQEIKYNFVELKNPNLKDYKSNKMFLQLNAVNQKIQKAILKQYKSGRFGYYQTIGLVEHYNNFIYYSNKYFSSLKNKEIYGNSKEVKQNIYNNFSQMKNFYYQFANLAKQKNMN